MGRPFKIISGLSWRHVTAPEPPHFQGEGRMVCRNAAYFLQGRAST